MPVMDGDGGLVQQECPVRAARGGDGGRVTPHPGGGWERQAKRC